MLQAACMCADVHHFCIAQLVVEKLLATEGTSRKELGREAFTERVWEWKVSAQTPPLGICTSTLHVAHNGFTVVPSCPVQRHCQQIHIATAVS